MLIDSHCHIALEQFDDDRAATLARARATGVVALVDVGIDPVSWRRTLALAEAHRRPTEHSPVVLAALGLHPNDVTGADAATLAELRRWLTVAEVVAIGETGLDYYWDRAPRAAQHAVFIAHLELARECDLPVIVHCREAYEDLLRVLAEHGRGTRGVLHCFSGDRGQMERGLACGYWISLAGPVTFKKATGLREIAAAVPADRLLIETDSPYLTPHPYRGQRNEPARVALVAEAVAAARGQTKAELVAQTGRNAATLFRLSAERVGFEPTRRF